MLTKFNILPVQCYQLISSLYDELLLQLPVGEKGKEMFEVISMQDLYQYVTLHKTTSRVDYVDHDDKFHPTVDPVMFPAFTAEYKTIIMVLYFLETLVQHQPI